MNKHRHMSLAVSAQAAIAGQSSHPAAIRLTRARSACVNQESPRLQSPGSEYPELLAFQALVNKCLSLAEAPVAIATVRYVSRSLDRLNISNGLRYDVRQWLGNKNYPIRSVPADVEELRRVTSLIHVGFREHLGPIVARQLWTKAMDQLLAEGIFCREALDRLV